MGSNIVDFKKRGGVVTYVGVIDIKGLKWVEDIEITPPPCFFQKTICQAF